MNWTTIFKRKKVKNPMPSPFFEDNWKDDRYERNVLEGVRSLEKGRAIKIHDDGRGYELAYDIKRRFLLEYQKQLAERVKIEGGHIITIEFKGLTN
jgi:hypothetical protein